MIAWLLAQTEVNPALTFLQSDLVGADEAAFRELVERRLLRPEALSPTSTVVNGDAVWTVLTDDPDAIEAFDPEDGEAPIVELRQEEVAGWRIDLEFLGSEIALRLELRASHEQLTPRVLLVGEYSSTTAVLLGLFSSTSHAVHDLAAIRELLPSRFTALIVILPALAIPKRLERRLAEAHVLPVKVNDDLSVTPTITEVLRAIEPASLVGQHDAASGFRYSVDFKSCRLPDGRQFSLTPSQSIVVEMLFHAYRNGTPDLSDEYLLSRLGEGDEVSSQRRALRDTFRDSDAWNALVVEGKTRGSHRLNLP